MKKKINRKKVISLTLITLVIILTIVFTILYKQVSGVRYFFDEYIFRKNIIENTLPKITNENINTYAYNDYIISLEKNVLTYYNKSATNVSTLDLEISNPIFETNNEYLCVAEKNGSKLYLISNQNILWQKNIEGKIINLNINKNGYVAVSIADTTYKTICKVYDNNGNELFTTYLSKSYIIDCAISDDNKSLALAEINYSGIAIQSNIKIISIDKALSNSTDTIQYNYSSPIDDFIINIQYCDDTLVCIFDNHVDKIKDNTISEFTRFENTNILFADINDKLIQIEKKNNGMLSSEFELQIINVSTGDKKLYPLDREPKSIQVFGNVIAVNFGTEILFINNSGWLIKDYTSSNEIQSIILSNDLAGIVFKDKVEFLAL